MNILRNDTYLTDLRGSGVSAKSLYTSLPLSIGGVWYWFDGSNSNSYVYGTSPFVTTMGDVSGNGNTFSRVDPNYLAKRVDNYLNFTDDVNNERYERYIPFDDTVVFNKSFSVYMVLRAADATSGNIEMLQTRTGGANVLNLNWQATGYRVTLTAVDGTTTKTTTNQVSFNTRAIICARHNNSGGGSGSLCIDGVTGASWTGNMTAAIWMNAGKAPARIHQADRRDVDVRLYETIIVTRSTSASEHTAILDYLSAKWITYDTLTDGTDTLTDGTDTLVSRSL